MHDRAGFGLAACAGMALLASFLPGAAGAAEPRPGNTFQAVSLENYLHAETGNAGGQTGAKTMSGSPAGAAGTTTFVAPGVQVLGVVNQPATDIWYSTTPWPKVMEVPNAAQAVLFFRANAQATTVFQVRLYDVAPNGEAMLIAQGEKQFVTALTPTPIVFDLHTQGAILWEGHVLALEVFAQTANGVVLMDYGGGNPSGIHDIQVRYLDSDGDGIADSDEAAAGSNPLDPTDAPGGVGADSDGDGLSDSFEHSIGTDPGKKDTDGDGFGDGIEVHAGSDPRDANSKPRDGNGNGLPDVFETNYFNSTIMSGGPGGGIDPHGDPDGDGCDNLCEAEHGTNPNDPDTDGDGDSDGGEIAKGSNPLGPGGATLINNFLGGKGAPEEIATSAFFAVGSTLVLLGLMRRN